MLWFDTNKDVLGVVQCPPKIDDAPCSKSKFDQGWWCNGGSTGYQLRCIRVTHKTALVWILRSVTTYDDVGDDQCFEWEIKYKANQDRDDK